MEYTLNLEDILRAAAPEDKPAILELMREIKYDQ